MRRKSNRSSSKSTTEKPSESQRKSRRQSKRQRKSSRSSSEDSEERQVEQPSEPVIEEPTPAPAEETEEPVWSVTPSSTPSGEIQKLKFCLTRPLMSPEKEKSGRRRRYKSGDQTDEEVTSPTDKVSKKTRHRGSSGDNVDEREEENDHQEDKKGKGKSKTKHKSKSEKSAQIQDIEDNSQSEISENVQVTPQSPQACIDARVDNESISTIESETVTDEIENPDTLHQFENSHIEPEIEIPNAEADSEIPSQDNQSNTPPPILEKHVYNFQKDQSDSEECLRGFEAPQLSRADEDEQPVVVTIEEVVVGQEVEVEEQAYETPENVQMEVIETNVQDNSRMDTSHCPNITNEDVEITASPTDETEVKATYTSDISAEIPAGRQESNNSSEAEEPANDDGIAVVNKRLSQKMEVDENHSEDAVSQDVTMDVTSTSLKDVSSLDITQSFSPDIKQLEQVNQELQTMKDKAAALLRTPTPLSRKWGNAYIGLEMMKDSLQKIDINTIKEFCPTLQFLNEEEIKINVRDKKSSYSQETREKRKVSIDYKSDDGDYKRLDTQTSVSSSHMEEAPQSETDNSNIIAMNRKISIVDDTASKLKPPPSPAKNPISEILYITNLVRPFTLKQLKELLERTGKIKENGFWTDRIKSKCYARYESTEEAEATRNALHGVNWPIGNGKKLMIEYTTGEDFEKARNPTPPPAVVASTSQPIVEEPKTVEKVVSNEPPKNNYKEDESKTNKERQRHRSEGHVREWDIGKENMQSSRYRNKEYDERNERNDRHKRRRTPSPPDDFLNRKEKKKEEDIPQKLMDDLFRKTKTTPSIYWLPLTPEEISTKQQQRLLRMAEHKRRMDESSRSRGDYGRGAPYRRRYD